MSARSPQSKNRRSGHGSGSSSPVVGGGGGGGGGVRRSQEVASQSDAGGGDNRHRRRSGGAGGNVDDLAGGGADGGEAAAAAVKKGGKGRGAQKIASASTNDAMSATELPRDEIHGEGEPDFAGNAEDLDVAELVRRAASCGTDDTAGQDFDGVQTIFSPWEYEDLNAASGAVSADSAEAETDGAGDMEEDRKSLLKKLKVSLGGLDLTRIAIPVYYNEPTSFLHRMCEACQYYSYLNKAAAETDPARRLMLLTVFAIVPYSSAERTLKPFNPIIGETFEWTTPDARFIAEQVSHHPPICAGHMETKSWVFEQHKEVKASFTGNAVVAPPSGNTYVTIKSTGEKYSWPGLTSCVHNLLVGRLWVDHYGTFKVVSSTGKEYAEVTFTQCGWFSRGWHECSADVYDAKGNKVYRIEGHWNDKLYVRAAGAPETENALIWDKDRRPAKDAHSSFKGFSQHGQELNELTPLRHQTLLASDSRFRPDCRALAKLNYRRAAVEKLKLENKQRAERKKREEENSEWVQRWFVPSKNATTGDNEWKFTHKYWAEREKRLAEKQVVDEVTPKLSEF